MTKPPTRALPDQRHARSPKPKAEKPIGKGDSVSIPMGGESDREGVNKSGNGRAETGAGATFSGSRVSRGGSTETQTRRPVLGPVYAPVAEGVDPGPGFYRFNAEDVVGLDFSAGRGMSAERTVETFAVSLFDAQKRLGFMIAKRLRGRECLPVLIAPTHHRATRLSKKARKAADGGAK